MAIKDQLLIRDYTYELPAARIASFPAEPRDSSKLLSLKEGKLQTHSFRDLPGLLPPKAMLVFNNTRVVQARIEFYKSSGARIEVFCLEPMEPEREIQKAFALQPPVVWKCLIGNAKKWKTGFLEKAFKTPTSEGCLYAEKLEPVEDAWLVKLWWTGDGLSLAEVLEHAGNTPIPPYITRKAVEEDKNTYQTVYACHNGSVAAPTAGLHFTPSILEQLKQQGNSLEYLTLHVGAGTFKPVSSDDVREHVMHSEQLVVSRQSIENIVANGDNPLIAVGTTSVRTLESLYWHGVMLMEGRVRNAGELWVEQWEPYRERGIEIPVMQALGALLDEMKKHDLNFIVGHTSLLIAPGYVYRVVKGLVTNFHQPNSTLLLLVAALIGEDWRKAYQYALDNDFRFLSYGDSCLFLP